MYSKRIKSNDKRQYKTVFLLLLVNFYLILYALDVYDVSLPIAANTIRTGIFFVVFIYAFVNTIFRPRFYKIELVILFYSIIVIVGLLVNNLFSLSKAANDLFFPLILYTFIRVYHDYNEFQIQKTIVCESTILIVFFTLFIIASFAMKLRNGMYLNSCYYCALLLPFALCIRRQLLRNTFMLLCLIPSVIALKRGAFLSVIIGIVVYFIAARKNEEFKINRNRYAFWGILAVIGIFFTMIYMSQRLSVNMIERLLATSDDGGSGRVDLLKRMVSLLWNNDFKGFLIGHGSFTSSALIGNSSHNDFLEMLWSYGILGFVPYIYIVITFVKTCRSLKRTESDYYAPCLVAIVEFIICSLVSQLVFVPTYVAFLLVFFALAGSIAKNEEIGGKRKEL